LAAFVGRTVRRGVARAYVKAVAIRLTLCELKNPPALQDRNDEISGPIHPENIRSRGFPLDEARPKRSMTLADSTAPKGNACDP